MVYSYFLKNIDGFIIYFNNFKKGDFSKYSTVLNSCSIRKYGEKNLRKIEDQVIIVSVINASQLAFHRVMYSGIRDALQQAPSSSRDHSFFR